MSTDRQLRQRADELRQQLKVTIQETREEVLSSMELTSESARCRDGWVLRRRVDLTTESIPTTCERLDLRTS